MMQSRVKPLPGSFIAIVSLGTVCLSLPGGNPAMDQYPIQRGVYILLVVFLLYAIGTRHKHRSDWPQGSYRL